MRTGFWKGKYLSEEHRQKLRDAKLRNPVKFWQRDGWKCQIRNQDCEGRLEAHHILSWKEYPELRYVLNNGITLCHAHHPRGRAREKQMAPILQELVASKDLN